MNYAIQSQSASIQEDVLHVQQHFAAVPSLSDIKVNGQLSIPGVPAPLPDEVKIGTLYINAAPYDTNGVMTLDHALSELGVIQSIREAGLQDFRFAEYGKGPGILSAALEEKLQKVSFQVGFIVDARTAEGLACVSMLTRLSDSVVRGF